MFIAGKKIIFYLHLLILTSSTTLAQTARIYIEADRTHHYESARSIEMGVKTALHSVGNKINGLNLELVILNHRGNTKRSKLNMDKFLHDGQALFYVAGLHSPPLIIYREYINKNKLLTLVPWAAGGPITRYPSPDNWVFRLSVDDTKAGQVLYDFAMKDKLCRQPHMLLEDTAWGQSNYTNITKAAVRRGENPPKVTYFDWNTKENMATSKLLQIKNAGSDCVLLVANAVEGYEIVRANSQLKKPLVVISHWGITGGNFGGKFTKLETKPPLYFIQSCFSFMNSNLSEANKRIFYEAKKIFPELTDYISLKAPTGFIHAYDLMQIVISAAQQINWKENMLENRLLLKEALENLQNPVQGLIKTYRKPFRTFNAEFPDAHEALNEKDLCMGKFGDLGEVRVIE